jgi:O-antigen/teichoic acid export membrane protein
MAGAVTGDAESEARGYGRRAGLLSIGVGLTGLITYLFFAIASHELSREDYGEVAVLWSAVFITVSTLQRPVEQLLSRTLAEHSARGASVAPPVRVAATIQLAIGLAFAATALLLRGPLEDGLLDGNETLYWIGIAAVTTYGASYFARGFLAGSHRLTLYALLIISESVSRTAFPLAVALGIATGQSAVALGIVAAPTLSLIVVPFAFLRRGAIGPGGGGGDRTRASGSPKASVAARDRSTGAAQPSEFTLAHGGGFALAVLAIMASEQAFLNAGPLLVKASAGAAAAGFIFNVLMIARAPLQLFQAVSTSLLPHLTRLRSSGEEGGEEAFRLSVRVTLAAIAGFTAVIAAAMLIAGPDLMQLAFGENHSYEREDLLIVTAGMGLYLSAATLNQAALAQGQVRRAASCWIGSALAFVAWTALPLLDDEFLRVEVGYLGAAALLCSLLYVLYRTPGAAVRVKPGSTEELELQLAAADEGS